jgi:hypothetical protein
MYVVFQFVSHATIHSQIVGDHEYMHTCMFVDFDKMYVCTYTQKQNHKGLLAAAVGARIKDSCRFMYTHLDNDNVPRIKAFPVSLYICMCMHVYTPK